MEEKKPVALAVYYSMVGVTYSAPSSSPCHGLGRRALQV
jgi:hypothetical protein